MVNRCILVNLKTVRNEFSQMKITLWQNIVLFFLKYGVSNVRPTVTHLYIRYHLAFAIRTHPFLSAVSAVPQLTLTVDDCAPSNCNWSTRRGHRCNFLNPVTCGYADRFNGLGYYVCPLLIGRLRLAGYAVTAPKKIKNKIKEVRKT